MGKRSNANPSNPREGRRLHLCPAPLQAEPPEAFSAGRDLLAPYEEAMDLLAAFERMEHGRQPVAMDTVRRLYDRLRLAVRKMLVVLRERGESRGDALLEALEQFNRQTSPLFDAVVSIPSHPVLLPLAEVRADMSAFVGHKAANLAAVGRSIGLPVPEGFVLTAKAFDRFMTENELHGKVEACLQGIHRDHVSPIHERFESIRRLILQAPVPEDIQAAVTAALDLWRRDARTPVFTAVRSTAVGEDADISFAGQFATLLNVPSTSVLRAYKEVLASNYSAGAILYRMRYGLDERSTPMAVMVMKMIPAMASGVLYTRLPSHPDQDDLLISAIHGLGEYLMSGDTAPFVFSACRRTGDITPRHAARQTHWMTTSPAGGTRLAPLADEKSQRSPLDPASARCLAAWGDRLEKHFGSPQDVEWAITPNKRIVVLQSRPLGLDGPPSSPPADMSPLEKLPTLHVGGRTACSGMVAGRLLRARGKAFSEALAPDSILVIPRAAPEYAPMIGRVRGVIAAKGSAASHLASVAREFGVPMIVDTGPFDDRWVQGQWVTLHADTATVYSGQISQGAAGRLQPLRRPMTTPLRRRLRALSNRIVPRRRLPGQGFPETDPPVTLHELLDRAHTIAMETLVTQFQTAVTPLRVIHWTAENAAGDFEHLGNAARPSVSRSAGCPSTLADADRLLQSLWNGLTWGPTRNGQPPLLQTVGWALLAGQSLRATIIVGCQQAFVDATPSADHTSIDVRFRLLGGDGPYYKRCLGGYCLGVMLDEMGFEVRFNGASLDALRTAKGGREGQGLVSRIGRLLAFHRRIDHHLVGPWAIERLQACFRTGEGLADHPAACDQIPSVGVQAGNWRQAVLDGRRVIVQDGGRVGHWQLPKVEQADGRTHAHRIFLEQLHRDHFIPLAIADDTHMGDGQIDLAVNLTGGRHACAGGVVFGYSNPGRFFLMGLDAYNKRITLYEMLHGRRFKRLHKRFPVQMQRWYDISLRITVLTLQIHLDGVPVMTYTADGPVAGRAGLWAWDDTVAIFDGLTLMTGTRRELHL